MTYYLGIICMPVIAAMLSFVCLLLGRTSFCALTISVLLYAVYCSVSLFVDYFYYKEATVILDLGPWIVSNDFHVRWLFLFDGPTIAVLPLILGVTFLVQVYSLSYMRSDPHLLRFITLLSCFALFMTILVTAGNLLVLFVGWEGVGLSSYLLINFWFTRLQANKSALKAIIVNRIADMGIYMAVLITFMFYKSLDFSVVVGSSLLEVFSTNTVTGVIAYFGVNETIAFLLLLGAMGKSAQIGFHTWLPEAMEGPTPVSALIHAATMVTAGVFLLIRCSPILEHAVYSPIICMIVGAITALFASVVGVFQSDIKKVIAYSTCSQLGYMFAALGTANYNGALFHLINHGFFKALLFLGAGAIIHAVFDQDLRRIGGRLYVYLPVTYVTFFIGTWALIGFPVLSGFYSKDLILVVTASLHTTSGLFVYWLLAVAVMFTAFYSFKLLYMVFWGYVNGFRRGIEAIHEAEWLMLLPLVILSILSIVSGCFLYALYGPLSPLEIAGAVDVATWGAFEGVRYGRMIPLYMMTMGVVMFCVLFERWAPFMMFLEEWMDHFVFFIRKCEFDYLYNNLLVMPALQGGYHVLFKYIDRGLIEMVGPVGLYRAVRYVISNCAEWQTGFLYHYIFYLCLFPLVLCVFITVFSWELFLLAVVFYGFSPELKTVDLWCRFFFGDN